MTRVMKRRLGDVAVALISAVLAIGLALMAHQLGEQSHQLDVQGQQLGVLEQALGDEQSNAEANGIEPVAPPAEDLLDDPSYSPQPGPSGPPGPAGPGLSGPQIEAAFAAYFAKHPYQFEPTAAELTAAFAAVLSDNPDLLHDQLYAAMASYLASNPPPPGPAGADGQDGADGADGQDGAQGAPGRPPTQDEIRAQVEAYVAEHGLPLCPPEAPLGPVTAVTTDGPVEILACILQDG